MSADLTDTISKLEGLNLKPKADPERTPRTRRVPGFWNPPKDMGKYWDKIQRENQPHLPQQRPR